MRRLEVRSCVLRAIGRERVSHRVGVVTKAERAEAGGDED